MKYVRYFLIIFGITFLAATATYFLFPYYRGYLTQENSLIENLSATFYLISFLVGFFLIFKNKMYRKALMVVSAISLLGFLDEISFGGRVLELNMSHLHIKMDAVHDLLLLLKTVLVKMATDYLAYLVLFLLISVLIATVLLVRYRDILTEIIRNNYRKPPFILVFSFIILVLFAQLIDLDLIEIGALQMVEEVFEMNSGLALLFCSLSLQNNKQNDLSDSSISCL